MRTFSMFLRIPLEVNEALWPFDGEFLAIDCHVLLLEEVADIGLVDRPRRLLDPAALLSDQLFVLVREILNALPNPTATLKPEITDGLAADTPVVADGSYWLKAALTQSTIPSEG
jgi:hypothetical protein